MPTFRFEHDDGRTYRIEASDAEAAQRVLGEAGLLEEAASEGTSEPQRGTAADVGVGALRGLFDVGDVAGSVRDFARGMAGGEQGGFLGGLRRGLMSGAGIPVGGPVSVGDVGTRGAEALGVPEPETGAGRLSRSGTRGAALGALTGPVFGAGAAASAIGGASGEAAAEGVRGAGGGGVAQFAAGTAADIMATLFARNPRSILSAADRFSNTVRAGRRVVGLDVGDSVEPLVSSMRSRQTQLASEAAEAWRAVPDTFRIPTFEVRKAAHRALGRLEFSDDIPGIFRKATDLPKQIDKDRLTSLLSQVAELQRRADLDPSKGDDYRRLVNGFRDSIEKAMDSATRSSDQQAVSQLRSAREATRKLRTFERFGTTERQGKGATSKVGQVFLDERRSFDDAGAAFTEIFSGKVRRPTEEARRILAAAGDSPEAQRAVRRGYLDYLFRQTEAARAATAGAPERVSPQGAVRKLQNTFGAAEEILGKKEAQGLLKVLNASQSARSGKVFQEKLLDFARLAGFGGVAGGIAGGPGGAAVGSLAGLGAEFALDRFGPQAVRELAVESLVNPALFRKMAMRVPQSSAAKNRLARDFEGFLARTGIRAEETTNRRTR